MTALADIESGYTGNRKIRAHNGILFTALNRGDHNERRTSMISTPKDTLRDIATTALDQATDIGDELLAYTKKHPLTAMLLALGAGALLISAAKSVHSRR
jgi:hypothetical protein